MSIASLALLKMIFLDLIIPKHHRGAHAKMDILMMETLYVEVKFYIIKTECNTLCKTCEINEKRCTSCYDDRNLIANNCICRDGYYEVQ